MAHSEWLQKHREAKNAKALERVEIAMLRLPNVLDREVVACQKTLEQKISDQGPAGQRADPHLLGLALKELSLERRLLAVHTHPATTDISWYANARTPAEVVQEKLNVVAPLYAKVATGQFPNLVGDALEVITYKCLMELHRSAPRHDFLGSMDLVSSKNKHGRYIKVEPPNSISGNKCLKVPDFFLGGFSFGNICIECKNLREWIYPRNGLIRDLIRKGVETDTIPLLIARRLHYTTITNLFVPAGIMSHESYYQYYPSDNGELASAVSEKRSLGFSDVRATEQPDKRTQNFFLGNLPKFADNMAVRFRANKSALIDFADGNINLAQLYNAIGSPAAGKWVDANADEEIPF